MRNTADRWTGAGDFMGMNYGPMLNAYPDSLGGSLGRAAKLLGDGRVRGAFTSFYVLPSLFHSDLDRGFSVIDYGLEESLASREDLLALRELGIDLKLDFVLNHLSVQSPQFRDLLEKGEASRFRDFFIDWNKFWEGCGEINSQGVLGRRLSISRICSSASPACRC